MSGNIIVHFFVGDGDVQQIVHEGCTLRLQNGRVEVRRQHDNSVVAYYQECAVLAVQLSD
ncbi:hypothetical protein [Rhodovibrio sodomensis]|uniref:hypothetical protein n=1 Tax=Rhodovibrio sodomensis TaxID=1088 RepID=UPI001A921311|nr:hypothetical protein [Rhodovibrio sodomensis]